MRRGFRLLWWVVILVGSLVGKLATAVEDEIIFVGIVLGHGAHTFPNSTFHNITAYKPLKKDPGRLTNIGKHQQYLLGRELASRYTQKSTLLHFDIRPQLVVVRAAGLNRSIESAEAFLLGLYEPGMGETLTTQQLENTRPPIQVQDIERLQETLRDAALPFYERPVPIHTTTGENDYVFSPHTVCPSLAEEDLRLEGEFARLDEYYRFLVKDFEEILSHIVTFPEWNLDRCQQLHESVAAVEHSAGSLTFALENTQRAVLDFLALTNMLEKVLRSEKKLKLIVHPVLADIQEHMAHAIAAVTTNRSDNLTRFAIFSLTDVHIAALHKVFNVSLKAAVPLASSFIFELHKKPNETGGWNYTVSVVYNGKVANIGENAKYDTFAKFSSAHTYKNAEEFKAACFYQFIDTYQRETYVALSIVLMLSLLGLWSCNWYMLTEKKKKIEDQSLSLSQD